MSIHKPLSSAIDGLLVALNTSLAFFNALPLKVFASSLTFILTPTSSKLNNSYSFKISFISFNFPLLLVATTIFFFIFSTPLSYS